MGRSRRYILVFMGLVLFPLGCGPQGPPDTPLGTPPPPPVREGDGLLDNPALQELVDEQVQRAGDALRSNLSAPEAAIRARAAFALGSVQDSAAIPDLQRALRDPDSSVRRDAAFALGQLGDPAVAASLLGALDEEADSVVRDRMIEALGKCGDQRALERLLSARVEDGESAAVNLAVARMGIRGVVLPSGLQHLISGLKDEDLLSREFAAYYFGRSPAPGPWASRAVEVRATLDSLPPSDPVAMHLILAVGRLGDPQDTPRILWWLRSSPDWRVRANAARAAAGRTSDPTVRAGLMEALDDPVTHVAYQAAGALSTASHLPPGERDALRKWVEDHPKDWRRSGSILALLGRLGEGEFILRWLSRWPAEDVAPRTRGLGALAFVPGEKAMTALLEAAKDTNPQIRATALGGLARRWRVDREDPATHKRYFQAFAAGLRTRDPSSSYVSAPTLADSAFLPLGSLDLLKAEYEALSTLGDEEGMEVILNALGETGATEVEPFLAGVAELETGSLGRAAEGALARLQGRELPPSAEVRRAEREVDWKALKDLGPRPRLILETSKGTVVLALATESAPLTVQTIAGFAEEGKYDGVPFHRVVPNFVVQGGDFARGDGFGGPGFQIRSEFTEIPYHRGVLGMARSEKDTEGSQFFITHSIQPHLDGAYTAFGWVESGMEVVDRIYEEDSIISARVETSDR